MDFGSIVNYEIELQNSLIWAICETYKLAQREGLSDTLYHVERCHVEPKLTLKQGRSLS